MPQLVDAAVSTPPTPDKPVFQVWLNFSKPVKLDVARLVLTNAVKVNVTAHGADTGVMGLASTFSMWLSALPGTQAVVTVPGLAYADALNITGLGSHDLEVGASLTPASRAMA